MLIRVKGLEQRDGVWKYRRMVPRRLRSVLPVYQIVRSLRTSDREAALRALPSVKAEVDRIFREAEAALANPAVRDYKAGQEVQRAVRKALEEDAEDRFRRPRVDSEPPSEDNPEGIVGDEEIEALAITDALEKLENAKSEGATTQRAVLLALLKRLNGQPEEVSNDDNPPLSIVFDRWREERQPPAKTWEEWNTARRRFGNVGSAPGWRRRRMMSRATGRPGCCIVRS